MRFRPISWEDSPGEEDSNPLLCSGLENPHGQRGLVGYSPWGRKESDTTEWLSTAQHRAFVGKCSELSSSTMKHAEWCFNRLLQCCIFILNMTLNIFRDETGRIFGMLVNLGTRQLLTAAGFTKENNAPGSSSFTVVLLAAKVHIRWSHGANTGKILSKTIFKRENKSRHQFMISAFSISG